MPCYVQANPLYQPAANVITAITNAIVPLVTTEIAHNYIDGTIVIFDIPTADGMQQINGLISPILVTSPTTFTITIDTTAFDVFSIPVSPDPHVDICAQVVPIGEVNETLQAAVHNIYG